MNSGISCSLRCRKRDDHRDGGAAISDLPPPPLPQEPDMLFASTVQMEAIAQRLADGDFEMPSLAEPYRLRIGRCGRLVFDRLALL